MSKVKLHIEYRFNLPQRSIPTHTSTEPDHSPLYAVGTSWDQVRAEWENASFGPLQKVGLEWPAYAWPGGYPMFYETKDGGVLSPEAANANLALTLSDDPQWRIVVQAINYEDHQLVCDHTGKRIQAAYDWADS